MSPRVFWRLQDKLSKHLKGEEYFMFARMVFQCLAFFGITGRWSDSSRTRYCRQGLCPSFCSPWLCRPAPSLAGASHRCDPKSHTKISSFLLVWWAGFLKEQRNTKAGSKERRGLQTAQVTRTPLEAVSLQGLRSLAFSTPGAWKAIGGVAGSSLWGTKQHWMGLELSFPINH